MWPIMLSAVLLLEFRYLAERAFAVSLDGGKDDDDGVNTEVSCDNVIPIEGWASGLVNGELDDVGGGGRNENVVLGDGSGVTIVVDRWGAAIFMLLLVEAEE